MKDQVDVGDIDPNLPEEVNQTDLQSSITTLDEPVYMTMVRRYPPYLKIPLTSQEVERHQNDWGQAVLCRDSAAIRREGSTRLYVCLCYSFDK